jgi:hypothetical protein
MTTRKTTRKPAAARTKAAARKTKPAARAAVKAAPAKGSTRVSGRQAIAKVLADGQPRTAKDITTAAVKLVRPPMKGKTPEATLGALLYTQAKVDGGLVVKTGKGEFKLNAAS